MRERPVRLHADETSAYQGTPAYRGMSAYPFDVSEILFDNETTRLKRLAIAIHKLTT